jgi:branched-chain amino acid transport system permease protein
VTLFAGTLIAGLGLGLLYGLLAFAFVLIFKTTGVANFATGNIAMFGTFIIYRVMRDTGAGIWPSAAVGLVGAALLGLAVYLIALRPRDDTDSMNLLMRTLAIYLLLFAVAFQLWGSGEPYSFPALTSTGSFSVDHVIVPWPTVVNIGVSIVLGALFWLAFYRTRLGLLLRGMAQSGEIARLLGVRTRRLTAVVWVASAVVVTIVGALVAPAEFLSSEMMDSFLLGAVTAAVLGGLTSLGGAFVGGVLVGVSGDLASVYWGSINSVIVTFAVMILVLFARPMGLFGERSAERI